MNYFKGVRGYILHDIPDSEQPYSHSYLISNCSKTNIILFCLFFLFVMRAFDSIIPFLSGRLGSGSAILHGFERIPLKPDCFQSLKQFSDSKLVFVDSGCGDVLLSSNLCLQFVRLYAGFYDGSARVKRVLREFFLLVLASQKSLDLVFEAFIFSIDGSELQKFSFDSSDPVLALAGRRAEPSVVASHVRKLLELSFMSEVCNSLSANSVLVRDGDLEPFGGLQKSAVVLLRSSAQSRGVVVLGISKTSSLCTDSGNSAVAVLLSMAPSGSWFYHSSGSVCFARLHPSGRVFRCDFFSHDRSLLLFALSSLAVNSSDPVFLGYPYGLIEADLSARVSREEASSLGLRFELQSKGVFRSLWDSMNAHELLNSL